MVKNLPPSGVADKDIRKHFEDIDNITDVKLMYNQAGIFRRFAFVGFKTADAAERAIEKLNNSFIKNNKLSLEVCKSLREAKPDKVSLKRKAAQQSDQENDVTLTSNRNQTGTIKKIEGQKASKTHEDPFEEVKDDADFKEFLNLQRNVGEQSKFKQIWADDAKMDADFVVQPNQDTEKKQDVKEEAETDADSRPRKKHKRSRGKKKSDKTKPKELFVYTAKIKGFPAEIRRKDVKDFFKPLEVISVRNNKKDGVCYVSFKDESDLRFALRKNMHFYGTSRINMWRHDVKRSRIFKETVRDKVKEKEDCMKKYEASLAETEPLEESGRLFVRNLNYTCTQSDLEQVFAKYGELTEVHFPIDKNTSLPKGYAYVEFMFPKNAKQAYEELNGTIFQGRNFHLIPSKPKPEPIFPNPNFAVGGNYPDRASNISSFKREKLEQQKQSAPKGSNWNMLFLGQNALADVVSDMKGIEKSELLTKHSKKEPIAVRMALGDAQVVEEMRKFLISNGIELDSFDNPQAPRSRTVIIVKNLPASTNKTELSELFELHGKVSRVIMPTNGLTAIVEMEESVDAKLAFKRLAFYKFKDSILYLEWAPINVFREKSLDDQERNDIKQLEELQTGTKILVKNIPFEATQNELKKLFESYGELNFVRIPKKIDGQHRGFGFVDFLTKEDALRAFRSLCHSTHLYGRKLVLEWAKASDETTSAPAPATSSESKQQN